METRLKLEAEARRQRQAEGPGGELTAEGRLASFGVPDDAEGEGQDLQVHSVTSHHVEEDGKNWLPKASLRVV